jgi:FkbM family methyltransferase
MIKIPKISINLEKLTIRIKSLVRRKTGLHYRRSFSQCGEDVIARTIFDILGVACPTYLDIGAHHPSFMSNTYLFYREGSRGISVEPDPDLYVKFLEIRGRDLNLNVAVGPMLGNIDLYIMSPRTLNTLSEKEARNYESQGYAIVGKHSVPVVTINQILDEHFHRAPDFLSVDVEGLDFEILSTLDFERYRPVVICIETILFNTVGEGVKRTEIDDLLSGLGYMRFADTYINSLYVDKEKWFNR